MASLTQWSEFAQTLGDNEGHGRLACCSPWDCKESDTTEHLKNNMQKNELRTLFNTINKNKL